MSAPASQLRRRTAAIGATLLLAALGVRLWYEMRPRSPLPVQDVRELERQAQARPDDLEAQLAWGVALQRQGRLDEAQRIFAGASRLAPQDARPYGWLGTVALAQHRNDDAEAYLRQASEREPPIPEVLITLAALYVQNHRTGEAIAVYERLTRLQPNDASAWRQLGLLTMQTEQDARSYEALSRAVRLDSADVVALRSLGRIALQLGRLSEAQQTLEQALARNPDDVEALTFWALATMQLDPSPAGLDRAEQRITRALSLHPTASAHLARGRLYLMRRRYLDAAAALKAALSLDPGLLPAYTYLSQAYSGAGQPERARQAAAEHQAALLRRERKTAPPARQETQR